MLFKNVWFRLALVITGVGSFILALILFVDQANNAWPIFSAMGEYMGRHHGAMSRAYGYGHHRMMGGAGIFGLLVFLLIAGTIFRRMKGHRHGLHHGTQGVQEEAVRDPLEVLSEAYARGELTRELYLERKAVLEEKV